MIPLASITHWRNIAPWSDDMQVEQDLILSKVIIDLFSDPLLSQELVFRGGTALNKLFFKPAARYSEDIDLVRTTKGPIKPLIDKIRETLDPWLGEPKSKKTTNSFKLNYYFNPETAPTTKLKIKLEINIRECFSCYKTISKEHEVQSVWFNGKAMIHTYQFSELIATKLRALYQRKMGRDAFDLWLALSHKEFDLTSVIDAFNFYMKQENHRIRKADFMNNLDLKIKDRSFTNDMAPLLKVDSNTPPPGIDEWNIEKAVEKIKTALIDQLPD